MNKSLFEEHYYADPLFPFAMYRVTSQKMEPAGRGLYDLHWHMELQFTIVTKGSANIRVNGVDYHLVEGEAIFINSGFLHMTWDLSEDGEYVSFSFPAKLLSFFQGSRMDQTYVVPYRTNYSLPVTVFSKGEAWKEEVLLYLDKIKEAMQKKENAFEYLVAVKLVEIWYLMISNLSEVGKETSNHNLLKQERMQEMLYFIHENYQNPITITDIANTAHISVGECCRCFKQMIHTSPYEYLCNYRINQSIDLLNNTNHSITEIAGMVGFGYTSQFIGQFKKRVLLTPAKYRTSREK